MLNKLRWAQLLSAIVFITANIGVSADIFVANDGSRSVTVYANSASGNAAPIREFDVPRTPRGIYVDTEIFVASNSGDIYVFDINADGTDAYIRNIDGNGDLQGIHATNTEIFVADREGYRIIVYARGATGSDAPLRTVDLGEDVEPRGVSVDVAAGELYVTIPDEVLTFSIGASGSAVPLRTITSSLGDMSQITFDRDSGTLVVANHGSDAIRTWPRAQNGGASPIRSIIGGNTDLDSPRGVAVCSGTSEYFASARHDDLITVYTANANGDVAPLRTIEGDETNLDSPRFMAVTGCDPAQSIPTMSVWGLGMLIMLLGVVGFIRRRKMP